MAGCRRGVPGDSCWERPPYRACFLTLIGAIGDSWTFWLFALFCIIAWVWIYFHVPETKGQSLEQIQQFWKKPA